MVLNTGGRSVQLPSSHPPLSCKGACHCITRVSHATWRACWYCGCACFSSLVSVARGQPGDARDVDPEDELIDISMDSPGADSRWYKCTSVAAFNTTLEFDATTPISGKINPGVIVEALEHADTRAGKRRIRSHKGWFSLVSTNGTGCELA